MSGIVLFDAPRRTTATPWYRAGGAPAPVAAYQPKGAANLASSYVNLANPGVNNAAPGVAPTWDVVSGWTFNGLTQYLVTGIIPASDQSWSMIARFAGAITDLRAIASSQSVGSSRTFGLWRWNMSQMGYLNGAGLNKVPQITSGALAVAGNAAYRNGVAESGAIGAWGGASSRDIYMGANNNGSAASFHPGSIQALAIWNSTLTPAQVAAVSAAIAAL